MTILKKLILSLAVAPLTVSMAFAIGGNDPVEGIDSIVKRPAVSQANIGIDRHIPIRESRVIKRLDKKTMANGENKHLEHKENVSACYRRYGNPPTVTINGRTLGISCEVAEAKPYASVMELPPTPLDTDYTRE